MIEVKDLSKSYGDMTVVKHLDLTIAKGEFTAFIGSNGAGKSTLLSMICRLINKDSGKILIDESVIEDYDSNALSKKISILKQSNNINLRLTIRELVAFGRFPYSKGRLTREDQVKIDEALAYVSLDKIQDKYLDELSGGQRQMAYIAMIIAQDTEFIFLDEPLNNLDMKHSVAIMKTLRKLVDELGKTIVIVIHDINFASCYADRILAMKNGSIIRYGKARDVINSDILESIYDMPIHIEKIKNQDICVYYN